MIGILLGPLVTLLLRHTASLLLQALGRDLRQRLPEVFAAIDAQVIGAMQAGASQVTQLFANAVQGALHRDASAVELRILALLFDPAAAASRYPHTTAQP